MADDIKSQTARVNSEDQATIVCPHCGYVKDISIGLFKDRKRILRVKCRCGLSFDLHLEFRLQQRKDVDLQGSYKLTSNQSSSGWLVRVINISLGGVCLQFASQPPFEVGGKGVLQFTLADKKETNLIKRLIIRSINGRKVGCQFITDKAYEKDLGFFLRS